MIGENKSAGKTEAAFRSMLDHCLNTPNANVMWLVSSMASFAQAARALQAFNFTPVDIQSGRLVCEMEMPLECPAAGTKAKVTVKMIGTPDDNLASAPTHKVEL